MWADSETSEDPIQIPYNLPRLSDSEVETYITLLICKRELPKEQFKKVHDFFISFLPKKKRSIFCLWPCGHKKFY